MGGLRREVAVILGLAFAVKVFVAMRLGLFGDEVFYAQCSRRLAWAYADEPGVTAWLVAVGRGLLGDTTLGVRGPFVALGAMLPLGLYVLARPTIGARGANGVALGSQLVPGLAGVGILATPDVPLVVLSIGFLATLERGMRRGEARWWILAGVCAGLAHSTHYRSILVTGTALVWLLSRKRGRRALGSPPAILALVLATLGVLPALIYNLEHDFEGIGFYLQGRHGGGFKPVELGRHLMTQLAIASPLAWFAILWGGIELRSRGRAGSDSASLLFVVGLVPILVFALVSPLHEATMLTAHWTATGHAVWLIGVPAVLDRWRGAAGLRRVMAGAVPGTALLFVTLGALELGWGRPGLSGLREPFVGWEEMLETTERLLRESDGPAGPLLLAGDNYKVAGQLELRFGQERAVYVLDHPKNRAHGRAPQFVTWGIDEARLSKHPDARFLVVAEWSQVAREDLHTWWVHIHELFEHCIHVDDLRVPSPGRSRREKHYIFFIGTHPRPRS